MKKMTIDLYIFIMKFSCELGIGTCNIIGKLHDGVTVEITTPYLEAMLLS
jgi:hypothetical protein